MTLRLDTLKKLALDRGGLLGLVVLVFYMWVAPPYIVDGDNAEFATLGTIGGTAHPTGYPLYLLWLRAMAWLPGATPAHTTALATAILAAASVVVLHAACRAWGAKPVAATIAAALYAGAPIAIRIGSRAEVFALNCLVVATVLWLAARGGPLRGGWRAFALGLVAGLGIANHMTCTLVAPVGILGVIRGVREAKPRVIAAAIGGLALGLVPYLYLFVTPETPLSWGKVESLSDLLAMVTRRDYGGPGAFVLVGKEVPATTQIWALVMTLGRTWLWVPFALGLATLVRNVVRAADGETRWAWGTLAVSWLVAGPLLATRFNIEPEALGLYVIQRFHVLPALLLAVPVAVGLTSLAPLVQRAKLGERAAVALVSTLGVLAVAGLSLSHVRRMHTPAVEQFARNVLHSLPPDAVVFAGQDSDYFGLQYVQVALGERRDVTVVAWQLTNMPWYARRLPARGIYLPDGDGPPIVRVVEYLLSRGRPVFFERTHTTETAALINTLPSYPFGTMMKALPRGSQVPAAEVVFSENKAIFDRFQYGYPPPGGDDEFATAIHYRYASTWNVIGRKLAAAGKRDDASWAFAAAKAIGPQVTDH